MLDDEASSAGDPVEPFPAMFSVVVEASGRAVSPTASTGGDDAGDSTGAGATSLAASTGFVASAPKPTIVGSVGTAVAVSAGTGVSTGASAPGSDSAGAWRRTNFDLGLDDPASESGGGEERKGK